MYFPSCTSPVGIFPDKNHKINPIKVPCGKCLACRISRSSAWALRSLMEFKTDEKACFLTLTYNDETCDYYLDKRDLQLFFKRLRKAGLKFRYFACGEYGETTFRPHFHILLFHVDFPEIEALMTHKQYLSNGVRGDLALWPNGFVHLGSVSEASAQYVAKYCLKPFYPKMSYPPFQVMSRRPALGHSYMLLHYKRILSGRDPLIRLCSMDDSKEPYLPRFVRLRCEEIEFYNSDFSSDVSERQAISKENRVRTALRRNLEKFGDNPEISERLQFEQSRQIDLNLKSSIQKRGCL